MPRAASLASGALVLALLALPGSASAATINVPNHTDQIGGGGCSLREAISAANNDDAGPGSDCTSGGGTDTIALQAGDYGLSLDGPLENTNASGDLDVNSSLTIDGAGVNATTVSGTQLDDRILDVESSSAVTIRELSLTNGKAPNGSPGSPGSNSPGVGQPSTGGVGADGQDGGAIRNNGNLTLNSMAIVNSVAGNGGDGGDAGTAGTANAGQAGPRSEGGFGAPGGSGGAVAVAPGGSLVVADTRFANNRAGDGGEGGAAGTAAAGAPGFNGGPSRGQAGGDGGSGGAIDAGSGSGDVLLSRVTFDGNRGGAGGRGGNGGQGGAGATGGETRGGLGGAGGAGALVANGSLVAIADSRLTANRSGAGGAGGAGGTTGSGGNPEPTGGDAGDGGDGAAISASAFLQVVGMTVDANRTGDGGAGGASGSTSSGTGASRGGAGGAGGTGTVKTSGSSEDFINATISGNVTGAGGGGGEAASFGGAGGDGGSGAGFSSSAGDTGFRFTTVASNVTGAGGPGGFAIFSSGSSGSAGTGGAVRVTGGSFAISNSIIASNSGPQQCTGAGLSGSGTNLAFPAGSGCPATLASNPLLGPLDSNGGDTPTRALAAGSPAIDKGPSSCPLTDQREVSRPRGPFCDLGAYERAAPLVSTGGASGVTTSGASLAGSVNANTRPTTYRFAYGRTTAYGLLTPVVNAGSGTAAVAAAARLAGLAPGTTYHYRVVAANGDGTALGADRTFTTAAAPTPGPGPAGTPAPPAFTGVAILTKNARSDSKGRVSVKMRCSATAVGDCSGRLTLKAKVGRKRVTLASARFVIASGKSKTVRLKLNRRRRGQLKKAKKLRGSLSASAVDARGGKSKVKSGRLGLKAPKQKRRR